MNHRNLEPIPLYAASALTHALAQGAAVISGCSGPRSVPAMSAALASLALLLLSACAQLPFAQHPADRDAARVAAAVSLRAVIEAEARADAAYANANWQAAQADYERVVALAPQRASAWLRLGNCRARSGQHEAAAQAYAQAAARDPSDARAAYNLALMRVAQAEQALRPARAEGTRAGQLATEIQRLHEVLRWLVDGDAKQLAQPQVSRDQMQMPGQIQMQGQATQPRVSQGQMLERGPPLQVSQGQLPGQASQPRLSITRNTQTISATGATPVVAR